MRIHGRHRIPAARSARHGTRCPAGERQPRRRRRDPVLPRFDRRDDGGGDGRAARPAGFPLWTSRGDDLVPRRHRAGRADRDHGQGRRRRGAGRSRLPSRRLGDPGGRLRLCRPGRERVRVARGRARFQLSRARRPPTRDAGRRLRTLRPALPAAGERQPRRRAAAEAAGDGARLDPGCHRRRGGPRPVGSTAAPSGTG